MPAIRFKFPGWRLKFLVRPQIDRLDTGFLTCLMRCVNNAMINPRSLRPRREVIAGIGTCTCSVPFFLLCACQAYCQDLTFWEYRFGVTKGIKVIVFSFISTMIGWYTESSTGRASLVHASHNNYLCLGWLHIPWSQLWYRVGCELNYNVFSLVPWPWWFHQWVDLIPQAYFRESNGQLRRSTDPSTVHLSHNSTVTWLMDQVLLASEGGTDLWAWPTIVWLLSFTDEMVAEVT